MKIESQMNIVKSLLTINYNSEKNFVVSEAINKNCFVLYSFNLDKGEVENGR